MTKKTADMTPEEYAQQRAYANAYNATEPIATKARQRARQQAADRRAYFDMIRANPCTDCRGTFPQECMEFDHVPGRGEKLFNVATASRTWAVVQAEIAKCDLVCANCHRIRTRARQEAARLAAS